MKMHHIAARTGERPQQLWVMLPGAYMKPADFIEAGFADAVRTRGLAHDIALLEATVPEIAGGSALAYLQHYLRSDAHVLEAPRVCLLGISLGAHLAMACLARSGPGVREAAAASRVAGACLLAPYPGPRDVVAQVAAGWPPASPAQADIDLRIWQWLQHETGRADLYLGYGSEDRFAAAHALMAQALPPDRVDVQPGGHAWPVWTALWNRHLDRVYAPA